MTKANNSVKQTTLYTHGVNKVSALRKVRYESSYFPAITIVGRKLNILSIIHIVLWVLSFAANSPVGELQDYSSRTCNNIMSA